MTARKNLNRIMAEKKVKNREFAKLVGMTEMKTCNIRKGVNTFHADYIPRFSEALGVEMEEFFK